MKFAVVASTGGSVMNELLKQQPFAASLHSVISDRHCGAVDKARQHGIETRLFLEKDPLQFSNRVCDYLAEEGIDYLISFYTKLFRGRLLAQFPDRIINLHPSLLPAFKGLNGFEDAISYGTRYLGTTIHFIDENMDEGKIILQSITPCDPQEDPMRIRHRLFIQQCRSLLQVIIWLKQGRITVTQQGVRVQDGKYREWEFSPNLDSPEAIHYPAPVMPPE